MNISLPTVRKALRYLRQHFKEVVRPLAQLSLMADRKRILIRATDPQHLMDATAEGQLVITVAVAPIVQNMRDRVAELRAPRELTVRAGGRIRHEETRRALVPMGRMGVY